MGRMKRINTLKTRVKCCKTGNVYDTIEVSFFSVGGGK